MRRPHPAILRLASLSAFLLLGHSAYATAYDWTAASGSTWATGWTGGNVPTINDDLTILGPLNAEGPLTINIAAAPFANTINITNTFATTLANTTSGANRTLTLQNGLTTGTGAVIIGSTTANQGVPIALSVGSSQTWNIGSGGLTLNNSITRNTGATVNMVASAGTITSGPGMSLNPGIFYNGDYAVASAAGAVSAVVYGTTANTSNVSGALTNTAGASYNVTGNSTMNAINLTGGTVRFNGNFSLAATGANSIAGFLTNGATAAVINGTGSVRQNGEMIFATNGSSDQLTVTANVTTFNNSSSTSQVTKTGAGRLVISGTNNTYNGTTYVNQGTLRTTTASGLGYGNTMTAINLGSSNRTLVAAGATLDLAPASSMTVNEAITLTGASLINSGSGTTTLDSGIAAVNLTNLGTGSATSGTVDFGGTGTGATATIVITGGAISSFSLSSSGTGYTGATPITFTTTGSTGAAATVTLSSLTLNGSNTIGGAGNLVINAVVADGTSSGGFSKIGAGTVTLNGANTYTGTTTATGGTLALGAADRIADTSNLVMSGGTFATGGFSETLGTLTLTANSIIDLGSGTSALVFADSSGTAWSSSVTLSFINFTDGVDSIRIGTTAGGLTGGQLGQITINGFAATIDSNGFITSAVPEPATYAAVAGGAILGFAALRRRRVRA